MMHISPMRETPRQRAARILDAIAGVLILMAVGVIAGITGGALVLVMRGLMP
jgi:hypothetical protein